MGWFHKAFGGVSKTISNVTRPIAKPVRKVLAVEAATLTQGLIPPKALGITNKSNQKLYTRTAQLEHVAAAGVLAVYAAPSVVGTASAFGKGLLGFGGKLLSGFGKIPALGGNSTPDNGDQTAAQEMGPGAYLQKAITGQNPTGLVLILVAGGALVYLLFFWRK